MEIYLPHVCVIFVHLLGSSIGFLVLYQMKRNAKEKPENNLGGLTNSCKRKRSENKGERKR